NCLSTSQWSNEAKETLIKAVDVGIDVINATTSLQLPKLKEFIRQGKRQNIEEIKKQFNRCLTKLAPQNGQLIIFIDELDRCKPTYAV
ncbi:P-loop NTPase fold protein, partial [Bartonella sp. CL63NXGY]|uniref:P-loop NTPase fold protein n=1 Tax=Bartonella sp. CL63NXGY TaxID=3243538 RepID=UPI0035D0B9BF